MSTKTERMYVIEREGAYFSFPVTAPDKGWCELDAARIATFPDEEHAGYFANDLQPSRVLPVDVTTTITLIGETK